MNKKGQKSLVFGALILLTIIILIIVPALWMGYGQIRNKSTGQLVETTLGMKIMFTLVGLFLVVFGWWNYVRQKNIDIGKQPTEGFFSKLMSGMYKASGVYARIRAIIAWIISGVLFIIAIAIFIGVGEGSTIARVVFGLVTIAIAIYAIIYGIIYWKRSKSLVKGRFY